SSLTNWVRRGRSTPVRIAPSTTTRSRSRSIVFTLFHSSPETLHGKGRDGPLFYCWTPLYLGDRGNTGSMAEFSKRAAPLTSRLSWTVAWWPESAIGSTDGT